MAVAKRIGVFGGTFNPVHHAHLILAEEIRERFRLNRVLFVPSAAPPHKSGPLPSGGQRHRMVALAVAGNPAFSALDDEVARGGTSYTVDTLRDLRRRFGARTRFFFLIGMDAFREITTWRQAPALASLTSFIIFPRPGHPLAHPGAFLPPGWAPGRPRRTRRGVTRYPLGTEHSLYLAEAPLLPLSASLVRRRLGEGRSVRYLVPDAVHEYIRRHRLYRRPTDSRRTPHTKEAR